MSAPQSLVGATRTWFQRSIVINIGRPRSNVTQCDVEKWEPLIAPNPGPY